MELNNFAPIVMTLVLVGMVLGVGLIIFDSFADAVKTDATITNETLTIASGAGTTANDEVSAVSIIINTTGEFNCTSFNSPTACANWTESGAITVNNTKMGNGSYWRVSYTYDADTEATTVAEDVRDATSPIGTTWMTLIVTVLVLAIILTLVIRSFAFNR